MDKNIDKKSLSEFFDSGVGLDFYNKTKDSRKHIKFREELQGFLCISEKYWQRYRANGPREKFDLLLGLDQYGDKDFSIQEIKELCEEPLRGNNLVEAIGD